MKHVLIACVVFALCLAVGLFSLFYVRASGAQTNELLERSIRQAETEDYTGAAASLRQAKEVWEGRERILGIFLHHEEVDEVIALFAQLEQFIRLEDLDDYLAACHELTARLEHIRRMELPTVENVMLKKLPLIGEAHGNVQFPSLPSQGRWLGGTPRRRGRIKFAATSQSASQTASLPLLSLRDISP